MTSKIDFQENRQTNFKDFVTGTIDTLRLRRIHPNLRSGSGLPILAGLLSVFPEAINMQTMNDPDRFKLVNAVAMVAIYVNDYVDMHKYLKDSDKTTLIDRIAKNSGEALKGIGFHESMPAETEGILQSYLAALGTINDASGMTVDRTLESTLRFKELENGISLVHNAALFLGTKEIGSDCLQLDEVITIQDIESKYTWLLKNKPNNETQRRLCGMFNLVMATQIIDDTYDRSDDRTLDIHNIYNEAVNDATGDRVIGQMKVKELEKQYLDEARQLGFSSTALLGNKIFLSTMKQLQSIFPHFFGGLRERVLQK